MRLSILCVLISALILVGCSDEPTIDGSSPAAAEASIAEVRESLDEPDRRAFDEAYELIVAHEIQQNMDELLRGGGEEAVVAHVLERIDGKTGQEVIELGAELGGMAPPPGTGEPEQVHLTP